MSSPKTRPSNRPRPDGSRPGRHGAAVRVPPRRPGTGDLHERSAVEWLREQQALIEEARRRARRRRQRYAALVLVLVGITAAIVVGFIRVSAVDPIDKSAVSALGMRVVGAADNGKIAFADDLGQLHVAITDASTAQVIEQCPDSPQARLQLIVRTPSVCNLDQPAWSPDGRQIAFVRGISSLLGSTWSLYVKDSDGRVRRLSGCGSCGGQYGAHLAWSPDSSSIALSREGPRGTQSLWVVDIESGDLRRLTDCQGCIDVSPDWAPNGRPLIVFSRMTTGSISLYTVRADGSHLTQLTNLADADHPQWSPDGRKIAFAQAGHKVFIADADGSDPKPVFDGPVGSLPIPSWSPDGSKLAFFNTPGRPSRRAAELWTIATDGSAKKRLYHSACCLVSWAAPIWSPDGKKIAFTAAFTATSAGGTFVVSADGAGLRQLSGASANGLTWQRHP